MRKRELINNREKKKRMNNTVVKIEMSGNRYNAYDIDGNKYTSEIGTSTRKGYIGFPTFRFLLQYYSYVFFLSIVN